MRTGIRRAVGVACAGVVLAGMAPSGAVAAAEAEWAPAASAKVHPGVVARTGNLACTSNFLFTEDSGALYLGMAALCARADAKAAQTDDGTGRRGCTSPSQPLGTPVELVGTGVVGTLAYSSWLTMQKVGEKLRSTCNHNNFALVKLPTSARKLVNPSLPILGGPVGLAQKRTRPGEEVVGYGAGPFRLGGTALSPMRGYVVGYTFEAWANLVYTVTPGLPGDSGSGYLDRNGRAMGSLANLALDPPGSNTVTDLGMVLDYARERGGLAGLRLIPGTEPFRGLSAIAPQG